MNNCCDVLLNYHWDIHGDLIWQWVFRDLDRLPMKEIKLSATVSIQAPICRDVLSKNTNVGRNIDKIDVYKRWQDLIFTEEKTSTKISPIRRAQALSIVARISSTVISVPCALSFRTSTKRAFSRFAPARIPCALSKAKTMGTWLFAHFRAAATTGRMREPFVV